MTIIDNMMSFDGWICEYIIVICRLKKPQQGHHILHCLRIDSIMKMHFMFPTSILWSFIMQSFIHSIFCFVLMLFGSTTLTTWLKCRKLRLKLIALALYLLPIIFVLLIPRIRWGDNLFFGIIRRKLFWPKWLLVLLLRKFEPRDEQFLCLVLIISMWSIFLVWSQFMRVWLEMELK